MSLDEEERCYETLPPEQYLKQYPDGKHAEDAKYYMEEDCFRRKSAYEYLQNYPKGTHTEEAKFYVDHPMKYLKKYPNGRYEKEANEGRTSVRFALAIVLMTIIAILIVSFN